MTFASRFKAARQAKRLTQSAVAHELGLTREAVSQWERGESTPPPDRMAKLAILLERDSDWLATGRSRSDAIAEGLPLWGDVAAGIWFEPTENQDAVFERVPVAPDPKYPAHAQFALRVKGNSLNRIARDGTIVACVDLMSAGIEARSGDLVLVERRRDGLVEATVKRLRKTGDEYELWPESDDPAHSGKLPLKPPRGEAEVQIKAIIVGVYTPIPRGD